MDQTFRYDVFLSFRGVDTRNNFTSHLNDALKRHNFEVFHDTSLPRGQAIAPQLLEAIKKSRILVVEFSTHYTNSKWCLDELSYMTHCAHMNDHQIVLPVFLDVKQSDFDTQRGLPEELITNHDHETLHKWMEALQEVGEQPGLDLQDDANGDEHALLDQIVEKIRKMLHDQQELNLLDPNHVGVESRAQEVISLLNQSFDNDDNGVRVVVICGPTGIGKSTIAKATYDRLETHFKTRYRCFISDVKTIFGEPNGKVTLQKKLISNIVQKDESRIHIDNYHQGTINIENKIKNQKILLALDDVDNFEQLKILGVNRAILGHGSRIIMTTTIKDNESNFVNRLKPDVNYKPRLLDENESLKVFCLNAFGQDHPKEGYEVVSRKAACCCAGNPVVLKTLAVWFGRKQSVDEWECELNYVIQDPSRIMDMYSL